MSYTTEVFRRIFDDNEGEHIQVTPDPDSLGLVAVTTSSDYYGKIDFTIHPDMAIALGNALIQTANEVKKNV